MGRKVEEHAIKITPETYEILKEVKKEQGIYYKFAMENAVKSFYGKKNNK